MYEMKINERGKLVALKSDGFPIKIAIGDVLRAAEDFSGFKLGEYYTVTKLCNDNNLQQVYLNTTGSMVTLDADWITSGKLELYLRSASNECVDYPKSPREYEVQAGDVLYGKHFVAPYVVLHKTDASQRCDVLDTRDSKRYTYSYRQVYTNFLLEDTPSYRKDGTE